MGIRVFDVHHFSVCGGSAVDTGVVIAGEHQHLVVGLFAELAVVGDIHWAINKISLFILWNNSQVMDSI